MHIYSFEKLETWQRARVFRKEIYKITQGFPKEELFGLTSQIKRSVSSISDCLAEGSGRVTKKDKAHYITMAYASTLETLNHIIGANDLGYINESEYQTLRLSIYELTNKLSALKRFLLEKMTINTNEWYSSFFTTKQLTILYNYTKFLSLPHVFSSKNRYPFVRFASLAAALLGHE